MVIAVRPVRGDEDYVAWRQVRLAVVPNERTDSVEDLRAQAGPHHEFLLAEVDGVLAGTSRGDEHDLGSKVRKLRSV